MQNQINSKLNRKVENYYKKQNTFLSQKNPLKNPEKHSFFSKLFPLRRGTT